MAANFRLARDAAGTAERQAGHTTTKGRARGVSRERHLCRTVSPRSTNALQTLMELSKDRLALDLQSTAGYPSLR